MEICSPAKTRYFSLKTVKLVSVTVSEQIRLTAAESMLIECTELLAEIISMLVFESARVFADFTGDFLEELTIYFCLFESICVL